VSSVHAQGISEPLEKGTYELGYTHYWYRGDFYWNPEFPADDDTWNNGTVYFRMGLYDILTLSVEGMIWPVNSSTNYPGESFLNYSLGMTVTSPSIEILALDVYFNLHYLENMYLDRSDQKHDKRFRDVNIGVPFRYQFTKNYGIWIAPIYLWCESVYFEDQQYSSSSGRSALSFGLDALLIKHIYLNVNLKYSDYFLPNIVAGFRF
jgi:hypothetical protein